jgi:translocator protein
MKKTFQLILSILVCQLAGIIGSVFTANSVTTWYTTLNKPFFNPPGWVFGPVWITLYTLMGITLFLIWQKYQSSRKKKKQIKKALVLFLVHLVFNALWSVIFFGLQQIWLAYICILILWLMIVLSMFWFYRINKYAMHLLIPYLVWVSFATVLNFTLGVLN